MLWLNKNRQLLLLFLIVLLAGFLRFYLVDQVPVSIYWDETAIAYNAYSILKTGKDEYGKFLPLLFRSFDDYKMGGMIYASIIPIAFLGLTEFSTRFTSAFLGTLTVFVVYFLIQELSEKLVWRSGKLGVEIGSEKLTKSGNQNISPQYLTSHLPLLTSLLLAISPWHIQVSRAGFEANGGLFFVTTGMWLLLKSLHKHNYLFIASIMLGISFYFYRSIHLFLPLLIGITCFLFRKEFLKISFLKLFISSILFFALTTPLIPQMLSPEGLIRFQQTNVFTNSFDAVFAQAKKQEAAGNTWWTKIIYNRRWVYITTIGVNYLKHFSPQHLFWDNHVSDRGNITHHGMMYLWEMPFLLIGIVALFKYFQRKPRFLLLFWLLLAPIPGALSLPAPHILRSLHMLPVLQLLVALGIFHVIYLFNKYRLRFRMLIIILAALLFTRYLNFYYGEWAKKSTAMWADGYKELTQYVFRHENKYQQVLISGHFWKPYIYFLFYKKYDPLIYQQSGSPGKFDKYIFGGTKWGAGESELDAVDLGNLTNKSKVLVALSPQEFDAHQKELCELTKIKDHQGTTIFVMGQLITPDLPDCSLLPDNVKV